MTPEEFLKLVFLLKTPEVSPRPAGNFNIEGLLSVEIKRMAGSDFSVSFCLANK